MKYTKTVINNWNNCEGGTQIGHLGSLWEVKKMSKEDLMQTEKIIYDMTTLLGGQTVLDSRITAKLRQLENALDKICEQLDILEIDGINAKQWKEWRLDDNA